MKYKSLIVLLILGFIIRVMLMSWSFTFRENTDVLRYKDWGRIAYLHGLGDTYQISHLTFGTLPNNQPPGSLYVISSMYYLHIQAAKLFLKFVPNSLQTNAFIIGPLLHTFLRLPQVISDLLIAVVIYFIVQKYTPVLHGKTKNKRDIRKHQPIIAMALFLFNPVIIYNSAVWGQMDSINNLFFIISLFFLLKKRIFFSLLCFFLSLYIKLSLIFFLPFFLLYLYIFSPQLKRIVLSLLAVLLIFFCVTLPISLQPFQWFIDYLRVSTLGEMQNITAFAFNFWWMIFMPQINIGDPKDLFTFSEVRLSGSPISSSPFVGIPLFMWGLILFSIAVLPLCRAVKRNIPLAKRADTVFLFFALIGLAGFLFLPRMHERYMYPLFAPLAIYNGITNKSYLSFIVLTFCNLINIYLVWHPAPFSFLPYQLMIHIFFQWIISLITVGCSLSLYIFSLRYVFSKNGEK